MLGLHLFTQMTEIGTGPSFKCNASSVFSEPYGDRPLCAPALCLSSTAVHHIQCLNARSFSSTCTLFQKLEQQPEAQKHTLPTQT